MKKKITENSRIYIFFISLTVSRIFNTFENIYEYSSLFYVKGMTAVLFFLKNKIVIILNFYFIQ